MNVSICILGRLLEMEVKLWVIIDDRIEKLVLPSGISPTVEGLQTVVKENAGISDEFKSSVSGLHLKTTLLLTKATKTQRHHHGCSQWLLNLFPADENLDSFSGQQLSDVTLNLLQSWLHQMQSHLLDRLPPVTPLFCRDEVPQNNVSHSQSSFWFHSLHMQVRCKQGAIVDYKKKFLTTSKVTADILEKVVETIYISDHK